MAAGTGPYLTPITAGAALTAAPVQSNFQQIQDFCGSVPHDNLNRPYANYKVPGAVHYGQAKNVTNYIGYHKVDAGGALLVGSLAAYIKQTVALAGAATVYVYMQRCTPTGLYGPLAVDVWHENPTFVRFDTTTTATAASEIADEATPVFATSAAMPLGTQIADGDWIRFRVTTSNDDSAAILECGVELHAKCFLRK